MDYLLPVETALDDIPALAISGNDAARLRRGQPILVRNGPVECADALCCAKSGGKLVALGHVDAGEFHPVRVFNLPVGVSKTDVDYA